MHILFGNCDYPVGLAFWALIPMVSIVLCVALAYFTHAISFRWGRWLAWFLLFRIWEFSLATGLGAPIAGMSWLFGWFAGSIYDEAFNLARPCDLGENLGALNGPFYWHIRIGDGFAARDTEAGLA